MNTWIVFIQHMAAGGGHFRKESSQTPAKPIDWWELYLDFGETKWDETYFQGECDLSGVVRSLPVVATQGRNGKQSK